MAGQPIRATLISWTANPFETIGAIWDSSKSEAPIDAIYKRQFLDEVATQDLFRRILEQDVPVTEHIAFNFICEGIPISLREQMVRHRIGVKYGDNYAVDIIPDADPMFWSQSMRIQSMSDFYAKDQYHIPASVADSIPAMHIYTAMMAGIADSYRQLVDMGVPMEDARNLIPLGATHRIAMTVNLKALQRIVGERSCWILQASLWHPLIKSMFDELATKVHPMFRSIVAPPCVKEDKFHECVFKHENERRVDGRDSLPVCPLYATAELHAGAASLAREQYEETAKLTPEFAEFWGKPNLVKDWSW